jgi:hypothetical protein
LTITAVAFALAGRRVWMLYRLGRTAQPVEPGRTRDVPTRLWTVVTEVFGQRKLLRWSVPGVAHFAVFWGFVILGATIVEGFGALFQRDFHIPLIGTDTWLGFLEDLFIVAVLVAWSCSPCCGCARTRTAPAGGHGSSARTSAQPGSSCS